MASWVFAAHHMLHITEILIFVMGLASKALVAALVWLLYVALEPYVRRRWPQTIISWTRVLNGQRRDPVVGGHMLVGILFGVLSMSLAETLMFLTVRTNIRLKARVLIQTPLRVRILRSFRSNH